MWSGDALALAYQVRYAYLMSTLWLFGPAASYPAFAAKLLLVIALLGAVAAALLGLLALAVRSRRH